MPTFEQRHRKNLPTTLSILSPQRCMTVEAKRERLVVLCDTLEDCAPDRYGSIEPLAKRMPCEDIDESVRKWHQHAHSVFW